MYWRITQIAHQLLSALAHLHDCSIVHRDIKPENVLFVGETVKLADFGSANFVDKVKRETVCGTPEYLAPEMVLKKGHDQKADIWGFGVLFFELLEGKTPFSVSGRTDLKTQDAMFHQLMQNILVLAAHQQSDIKMNKGHSSEAIDFVLKCLNRNPQKRWPAQALLRHPFITKHLHHHVERSQRSVFGERSTHTQSNLNIILSNKVSQKVLPEDDTDQDLEEIFKSNTTPFVSPSCFNSTLASPSPQVRRVCKSAAEEPRVHRKQRSALAGRPDSHA
jgi:serine/threonine protein kinase